MKPLEAEERKALSQYVYAVTAITLDDSKGYLLESRLGPIGQDLGCRSYMELLVKVQADASGTLRRRLVDSITTNETLFFRDTGPFDLLRQKLLPDLFDVRSRSGSRSPIRIWSAACSTGQEIYSIGMIVKDLLGAAPKFDVRLFGTDISNQAVAKASKGVYSQLEISRGMNDPMLAKYFVRAAADWRIRDEIRAMASFKTMNLMEDFSTLGRFDIIFCRNVAIYFNDRDRVTLFGRIERALERDGSLVIGAMESLNGVNQNLISKRHLRTIYYQRKDALPLPPRM